MSWFFCYDGLFVEGGEFDILVNYLLGVVWMLVDCLSVVFDYEWINYSGVQLVSNCSLVLYLFGVNNGFGFGWYDVKVWKLGVEYVIFDCWTWCVGLNYGSNFIQSVDVIFNIVVLGVVMDYFILGFIYMMCSGGELMVVYMYVFSKIVQGVLILLVFMGGVLVGQECILMYQNLIGISYGCRF